LKNFIFSDWLMIVFYSRGLLDLGSHDSRLERRPEVDCKLGLDVSDLVQSKLNVLASSKIVD